MNIAPEIEALRQRNAPLEMPPGEFREIGGVRGHQRAEAGELKPRSPGAADLVQAVAERIAARVQRLRR